MNIFRAFGATHGLLVLGISLLCGGCGGGSGGMGMTSATPASTPAATAAVSLSRVVACVGDSITEGGYPALLGNRLGSDFEVRNFGRGGTTMRKTGSKPYWNTELYPQALALRAETVVIMLGTNDDVDLPPAQAEFVQNYKEMIRAFRNANRNAKVYVCLPPPIYRNYDKLEHTNRFIRQAATESQTPIIDIHTALSNKRELFPDTVHPNAEGSALIAAEVYRVLESQGSSTP